LCIYKKTICPAFFARDTSAMSKALPDELRENCVYLREGGWRNTAVLMQLAADELERLEAPVNELEKMQGQPQSVHALVTRWLRDATEGVATAIERNKHNHPA
jgi:hypothetical protein